MGLQRTKGCVCESFNSSIQSQTQPSWFGPVEREAQGQLRTLCVCAGDLRSGSQAWGRSHLPSLLFPVWAGGHRTQRRADGGQHPHEGPADVGCNPGSHYKLCALGRGLGHLDFFIWKMGSLSSSDSWWALSEYYPCISVTLPHLYTYTRPLPASETGFFILPRKDNHS